MECQCVFNFNCCVITTNLSKSCISDIGYFVLRCPLESNHFVYQILFPEFAEKGSIFDYIHVNHNQSSLAQRLLWLKQVAEGTVMTYFAILSSSSCSLAVYIYAEMTREGLEDLVMCVMSLNIW